MIYSAVGSFYAPMLVMMFFNWKIYRTATKTTKAIRQGWTRVKGVSGDDEIGLGIHRGGGANRANAKNGSSRSNTGANMDKPNNLSRMPSSRMNGMPPRDLNR